MSVNFLGTLDNKENLQKPFDFLEDEQYHDKIHA